MSLSRGETKKAVEQLTTGLAKASGRQQIVERLIDLQFHLKNLDAVRALVKQMRERDTFASEMVRFQDARIKFAENKFQEASREFEAVTADSGAIRQVRLRSATRSDVGSLLRSAESAGSPIGSLSSSAASFAHAGRQPGLGEATALQSLGRHEEAATSIKLLADNVEKMPFLQTTVIYMLINEQLQLPEDQRDWTQVDKIADLIYADKSRPELGNCVVEGPNC